MLIIHSMPTGIIWTGPVFLTDPDALTDSKPARATRVEFISASIFDTVTLQGTWTTAKVIGGMQVIFQGGVPANTLVRAYGRRPGDPDYDYPLGGNSLTATTVERPDGTVMATFLFDAMESINGLAFVLFNNSDGATYVSGYVDIGEIFFGEVMEVCIRPTPGSGIEDPTLYEQTIGNQPHVVRRKEALLLNCEIAPISFESAFMAQQSLARLRARLVGKQDCLVIFATRPPHTGSGAVDYDVVQNLAMFGKCTNLGEIRADTNGKHWTMALSFRESPGRLVS